MTPFQLVAVPLAALVAVAQAAALVRGRGPRGPRVAAALLAAGAAAAIAAPELVQAAARAIGIGRGADVVLYVSVLAFAAVSLVLYARTVELRRQLTAVVRALALQGAREPAPPPGPSPGHGPGDRSRVAPPPR